MKTLNAKIRSRAIPLSAVAVIACAGLLAGPAMAQDVMTKAEKKDTRRVGILEAKDIAEKGFIYGLPLVMNYAW